MPLRRYEFTLPLSLSAQITSTGELAFTDDDLLLAQAYVPGLERSGRRVRQADITISHVESSRADLVRRGRRLTVQDRWNGQLPLDAWFLLYAEARRRWLERQVFSVHGACLGMRGGILIVGHSGSGKSTVAMEMLRRRGVKLFSGNKTLVTIGKSGALTAIAGTMTMTVGAADRKRYARFVDQGADYWGRYAFSLKESYRAADRPLPIRAIAVVRLNDGIAQQVRLQPVSALHTLYPFFLDAVNADVIAGTGSSVLVGTPPPGTQEALARNLERACGRIPVHVISGSLSFVGKRLASL